MLRKKQIEEMALAGPPHEPHVNSVARGAIGGGGVVIRVHLVTATVGQSYGTCARILRHHPGCRDHGEVLAETGIKPHGFTAAALNSATDLATDRGWTVVDEDWEA